MNRYRVCKPTIEVLYNWELTQVELSKILGVPASTISYWYNHSNAWTSNKRAFQKLNLMYEFRYGRNLMKTILKFLVRGL